MSEPTPTQRVEKFIIEYAPIITGKQWAGFANQLAVELEQVKKELDEAQRELIAIHLAVDAGTVALMNQCDHWKQRAEELETKLRIIGDKAVRDWDDATVGEVDAVIKTQPPTTYAEFVRQLYYRKEQFDEMKQRAEKAEADSKRLDWLQSGHCVGCWVKHPIPEQAPFSYHFDVDFCGDNTKDRATGFFDDIRQAIDTAMKGEVK